MTLQIGAGNASQGNFATIDWGDGPYYLKSEVDPNGGSNYTVTSVQQLLSVPYALYAAQAGNVPDFAILPTDTGYVLVLSPAGGTPQTYVLRNGVDGATGPAGPEGPIGPIGPTGPTGPAGVGILSITGPLTNGLEDTYTIHYTDGTTSTFVVTNGSDGEGVAQTLTLIGDQLSISGGNTVTLPLGSGAPGRGIQSISDPVTNGLENTYRFIIPTAPLPLSW